MSEADVTKMRRTFDDMLMGRNRETLRNEDIFSFIVRRSSDDFYVFKILYTTGFPV